MTNLIELEKYLDYKFSSGAFTGKDYLTFQTKYINYLKSLAKESGFECIRVLKSHYQFSTFFKLDNKYIYLSISDVRYFQNEWYNHILFRTSLTEYDYTGGQNFYTNLPNLKHSLLTLFNKEF